MTVFLMGILELRSGRTIIGQKIQRQLLHYHLNFFVHLHITYISVKYAHLTFAYEILEKISLMFTMH